MKKFITFALVLSLLFTLSISVLAFSEGFDADLDFEKALTDASGGKNVLRNPEFVEGGDGFNDAEGSASLFDFDISTKYCTNESNFPYTATWKYDKAYSVERIILGTANDSESNHRRLGNSWTLSGSANGTDWTVIYTGKPDDIDHTNFMFYYIDLPEGTEAYQYYKINSEETDWEDDSPTDIIQIAEVILCGNEPAAVVETTEAPAAEATEAPALEATEAPAAEATEAPAAEVAPVEPAAQPVAPATADMTIVYVLAAAIAAAGALAIRAKKNNI